MKNIRFTSLLLVITGGALWLAAQQPQAPQALPARPVDPVAADPADPVDPVAAAGAHGRGKQSSHGLTRATGSPNTTPYRTHFR